MSSNEINTPVFELSVKEMHEQVESKRDKYRV